MKDRTRTWGSPDREYAYDPDLKKSQSGRDSRPKHDVERQSLLWSNAVGRSLGNDLQVVVDRTVKQWNGVVREWLRKQTGLRLSTDTESGVVAGRSRKVRSVPIRVVGGLPAQFAEDTQDITPLEIMLLLNKSKLNDVIRGTDFMIEEYKELSTIELHCATKLEEIESVKEFSKVLQEHIKQHNQSKRILEIEEDVLGSYFFRIPEIRLYWIVIGIYSQLLDLPIEALTVVVLIHELAHAYTHLGYDIDNRDWNTEDFARSDLHLVEGLAQFYTMVICEQIQQRFPAARNAFERLLENQSDVYREHEKWLSHGVSEHVGETVRVSMLECRSKGVLKKAQFQEIVERARENFRKVQHLFLANR